MASVYGVYVTKANGEEISGNWSNSYDNQNNPPAIGERVETVLNGLGVGVVKDYFEEAGFIGLVVWLDDPPQWFLNQCHEWDEENPENKCQGAMIFGREIKQ